MLNSLPPNIVYLMTTQAYMLCYKKVCPKKFILIQHSMSRSKIRRPLSTAKHYKNMNLPVHPHPNVNPKIKGTTLNTPYSYKLKLIIMSQNSTLCKERNEQHKQIKPNIPPQTINPNESHMHVNMAQKHCCFLYFTFPCCSAA